MVPTTRIKNGRVRTPKTQSERLRYIVSEFVRHDADSSLFVEIAVRSAVEKQTGVSVRGDSPVLDGRRRVPRHRHHICMQIVHAQTTSGARANVPHRNTQVKR